MICKKMYCNLFTHVTRKSSGARKDVYVHPKSTELEFGVWVFVEGGDPENPEKNPRSRNENQQQTQPMYGTGPESNPGDIGGRRVLSPLRHP